MNKQTKIWMQRNARPLELARWEYLFDGGSRERVIQYLASYQNEDGGFGNGLEPDFWMPDSSAIATWSACQQLIEVNATKDEKIVRNLVNYLLLSYNREAELWLTVTPEHNLYPHAPHWQYTKDVQSAWMYNPSVELAAYLIHWSNEESEANKLGWQVIEKAFTYLQQAEDMGFYEINNYQKAANLLQDKMGDSKKVLAKIHQLAERAMNKLPDTWGKSYGALPLDLIHNQEDLLYHQYRNLVEENIVYLHKTITTEGVWNPSWDWGDDQLHFAVAKQQWMGIIAINNQQKLQIFQ